MKTAILYYTLGGSTEKEAERLAKELGDAKLIRVREARSRSLLGAFIPGGFQAMKRRTTPIRPIGTDLEEFDRLIIGCPVWAGFPAPVFNAIIGLLPAGKTVELFLCSGGGESGKSEKGTRELVEQRGCKVTAYRNVKTGVPPGKRKE